MSAVILPIQQPTSIQRAVQALQEGALVVIPTDTVYGLAVAPGAHDTLLERLYDTEGSQKWPALPLLLDPAVPLTQVARTNRAAAQLAEHFWPGALTLLLPVAPDFPFPNRNPQVAVRKPNLPALWPLLQAMGGYLIVGRAARSGYPSAITAQEAADQLGEEVDLILDGGASTFGITSTVVDCIEQPPRVVQRGAIPEEKVHTLLVRLGKRNGTT